MIDLLILIFTYLPSILVHIIVTIGILGFIASLLPFIIPNKIIVKYVSIFLIVLGVFLEGGLAVNTEYLERAKEWNNKIALAEAKAEEVNNQIQYIYVDKIKVVKEKQIVVRDRIKKVAVNIDKECVVSREFIDILNTSAYK